jgi:hypothetical protein
MQSMIQSQLRPALPLPSDFRGLVGNNSLKLLNYFCLPLKRSAARVIL